MKHYEFESEYYKKTKPLRDELDKMRREYQVELLKRQAECTHYDESGKPDLGQEYLMCDQWGWRCELCGKSFDDADEELKKLLRERK